MAFSCVCVFRAHVYIRCMCIRICEAKRAGQCNLSAGSLSTWRVDKGGDRHTDVKTDQISFSRRNAVKGNGVAASPPGISTPKKHGEMKGDMEICSDTAVSLHLQHWFMLARTHTRTFPQVFTLTQYMCTLTNTSQSPPPLQHHIPLRLCYWFALCSDSAYYSSPTFSLSARAHVVVVVVSRRLKIF